MIDHLVLATPDVTATAADITSRGITLVRGGSHVGRGTRNELAGLGAGSYLEVVGPDSEQPTPPLARPFMIDDLTEAVLLTWCARPSRPLEVVIDELGALGIRVGNPTPMGRLRPDGVLLRWRLTEPLLGPPHGGVLPFLIDWLDSPHPSQSLSNESSLESLELRHPDAPMLRAALAVIGDDARLVVEEGTPRLRARVRAARGVVVL